MPEERPPLGKWAALSIQNVFAMFGATILVPVLVGLPPASALFTAGTGTLLYILITKAKVPIFLGSSFAFIPPLLSVSAAYGMPYAMGGAFAAGIFYCIIAGIISLTGLKWIDRALPPVVIGSVIVCIGLNLAPTAVNMASLDAGGNYSLVYLSIAAVTLFATVITNTGLKGFFSIIPILIGLAAGYLFTLIMGAIFPAYHIISFDVIRNSAWFGLPHFAFPKFNGIVILTFVIVSIATICEHLGDTLTISKVVGRDFYKNPGIHKTLIGDGLATSWAALWGGPPNTTYGENIATAALTRVYSVWVTGGAAVIAVFLSFVQKFSAFIQTIPSPVLGGISMLLFGTIASSGLRTIVESGVDFKDKRNLTIASAILCVGIGGGKLMFKIGGTSSGASSADTLQFQLAGVALATVLGILLNLFLPKRES
ncbi:MAG: NCS2 family nucleobase:cation symporter [Spirochaetaceae bacterium]|jgi:uracil permease|nr:NCS2 family nucleobase:cation symporter [Spirochaetaceae bacterium]